MRRFFERVRTQRRAIALAAAVLTAVGFAAGVRLPAAILPEVTFPRITVIADSGERPGEEMLRSVTRPLEESLRRVPGVLEIRSTTSRGSSEINLDCEWRSDMDLALQRVQGQLSAVRSEFPEGTSVEARLMNPVLFPVLGVSLTSPTLSQAELRDLALLTLKPELARLPGVAEVVVQGGRRFEARVTLDPAALQGCGLDAARVAEALKKRSELESVGLLDANRELYLGLADARPADLESLGDTPVPVESGPPVPLRQLGRISLEEAPEFTRYAAAGREAVLVNVLRQPSASTIDLSRGVHQWFREHRSQLPRDLKIETFYDQADLVAASVGSVRDSLVVGALLAILAVALVLGSWRLGLAGALVLPGSIGCTLLGFVLTRQSLNIMTLGGIAAAVGLVLDDAIVVVEHLAHRAEQAGAAFERSAAMAEIMPSLVGSSLCSISIFAPFMLLGGVSGAFFRVLALSMTLMLGSSLLLCLSVIPLLSRPRLSPGRPEGELRADFHRLLKAAAARRWVAFGPPLALVLSIVPLQALPGSGFLPDMDEGSLILDYILPPGTSLSEGDRMLRDAEREIAATPEIVAWSRRQGNQLGFFITEPNTGDYTLQLRSGRRRSADEVADHLRARLEATEPAMDVEFGQLIEDAIGDLTTNPQPVEVRVFSEDHRAAQARARDIAALLDSVRGVVDVRNGIVVSGPDVSVVPAAGAARAGLSAEDLARAVQPAVSGLEAGEILRGVRAWPVRVVLPQAAGVGRAEALAALPVPVQPGRWARLGDLATLRVDPGETEIARDNLRTMVPVTARLSGRDLGSAMGEIRARLGAMPLPRGMSLEYAGMWAEQQSSFRGLAAVLVAAAVAVLLILLAAFHSWRQSLAVLLVVAASLPGALLGLLAGGVTLNICSFVGAIMVVGIVGENAFFLVAAHREALRRGESPLAAAVQAARRRARPVLMTTAAGVAALSPLAIGLGPGSALLRPLALAVVGGFTLSAPLLLGVLPALLARAGPLED
ncbi:MAG TPA: efflux RND transporter permease subunit [Candidatus Saccharimonadales bacterium]|nr:efflux RND transporter permease subunit [Candidatus Saccharimonadales bacterium]